MKRLKMVFLSSKLLFISLPILGILAFVAILYATVPIQPSGDIAVPNQVASSSPTVKRKSTPTTAEKTQADSTPAYESVRTENTEQDEADHDGINENDLSTFSLEAFVSNNSHHIGAEQKTADHEMRQILLLKGEQSQTEIQALEAEKLAAYITRDDTVLECETTAGTAEKDLIAATVQLHIAEQKAPQLLAIGENPYIAINEAKALQRDAIARAEAARTAAQRAQQDCDNTVAALQERIKSLKAHVDAIQLKITELGFD